MRRRNLEDGQILVLFAGSLLLILTIVALVIDLGFVWWIRRAEQNAADPGAIAAARYVKAGTKADMTAAACFYAHQNGFFGGPSSTAPCVPANDGYGTALTVNYPPSAAAGTFAGNSCCVEVVLQRPHQSFFAGLLGIPRIGVSTSAVAAFGPSESNSSSLIALDPGGCSGNPAGVISGGGLIDIQPVAGAVGGYVHVNSTCASGAASATDNLCSNGTGALDVNGSGRLNAPAVYIAGACTGGGGSAAVVVPTPGDLHESAVQIGDPLLELSPPVFGPPGAYCGDPIADPGTKQTTQAGAEGCDFKDKDKTYELSPGVYYGGWKITGKNVTLHLKPGVYVIAGGGIDLSATGEITSVASGTSTPAPVLIYSTDDPQYASACKTGGGAAAKCQGKINFTAGSDLLLAGVATGPYKGILIWQDGTGSAGATACDPKSDVTLSGQTSLSLSGTIYAPRSCVTVDGGGTGSGYAAVQIISWRWKVSGGGTLHMPYDPNQLYQFSFKGLVH